MSTEQFGKGAVADKYDIRDYHFAPGGGVNWNYEYDIEKTIGFPLVTKNQNGSFSCGGQAWAYYGEVLEYLATSSYEPRSARYIYSNTFVPMGGSAGRDNSDFVVKNGFAQEAFATSYENGAPPSETFMRWKPTLNADQLDEAKTSKALSYLQVAGDIDHIAEAISRNNGCIILVHGEDNGTWHSLFPKAPTGTGTWNHWLYAGRYKVINGKKHIGVKNSWGDAVGENGWQWLSEDYFDAGGVQYGWTLAWDYRPAKIKVLLAQVAVLLKALISMLQNKK